jgi:hypothetical protein
MGRKGSKAAFNRRMKRKLRKGPKMKKWEIALLVGAFLFAFVYVIFIGKLGLSVPQAITPTVTPAGASVATPTATPMPGP